MPRRGGKELMHWSSFGDGGSRKGYWMMSVYFLVFCKSLDLARWHNSRKKKLQPGAFRRRFSWVAPHEAPVTIGSPQDFSILFHLFKTRCRRSIIYPRYFELWTHEVTEWRLPRLQRHSKAPDWQSVHCTIWHFQGHPQSCIKSTAF